jgi:hypothetical protein
MGEMDDINEIILRSLEAFLTDIRRNRWYGRENEAINLFIFSHLLDNIGINGPFYDRAQVGIEVAVTQVSGRKGAKDNVRKDLVIWRKPGDNCWVRRRKQARPPLAIIEWKVIRDGLIKGNNRYDLDWLKKFTGKHRKTTGYAVSVGIESANSKLIWSRIELGELIDSGRIPKQPGDDAVPPIYIATRRGDK